MAEYSVSLPLTSMNKDKVRVSGPIGPEKRVDVVVVSFNSGERLRACVERLSHEPLIQVIVVDNASNDDSRGVVADLPLRVVALERNVGFGAGCNVGWRTLGADVVLFLNPDAQISPDNVFRLADILQQSSAGAIAPRIVNEAGELEWSLRRFPKIRSVYGQALLAHHLFPKADWVDEVIRDPERYEREAPCDWASGACLLVRRDLLERIGGFDEDFFMYCEDVDLCRRLWDLGQSVVYTPSVVCTHAGGASAPRWRLLHVLARSRIHYAQKHFGRMGATVYRVGVALNAFTHLLVGRGIYKRLGHAQALAAAAWLSSLT